MVSRKAPNKIVFDACISKVKEKNPNLRIVLWGHYQLENECMRIENTGIVRYWFDGRAIDFKHINDLFDLARNGWLSHRYIPDMHAAGFIQSRIQVHLRYPEKRRELQRDFVIIAADYTPYPNT